jgi:hypothetical protein
MHAAYIIFSAYTADSPDTPSHHRWFMDAERLLGLVEAACRDVGARWALIGGMAMKVRSIQSRPTRVFRDGADLEYLLRFPGLDDNEARGFFERAGLLDLYDRLRRPL